MANPNLNLPSRTLVARLASCRVVLWALETHGPRLAELFEKRESQSLPESLATSFTPVVETLINVLREARDLLTARDRRLRDQSARLAHYRGLRDAAFDALSPYVKGMRDTFLGACGPEVVTQLGFALRMPQQPGELFEQAQHLSARLGEPELVLPEPRYQGVLLDAAELVAEMQPLVETLGETLEHVSREERLADAAKIAKDEMVKAYDRTFVWSANTAESLFRLAGLPEVAKRVRPSTRRSGVTREVASEGPGAADDPEGPASGESDASAEAEPPTEVLTEVTTEATEEAAPEDAPSDP